jgi:transposase
MASLVLKMSVSLDGYVAPIDGSTDWIAAGGSDDRSATGERTLSPRWVVERTFAWLHQFRRLRIRWERRPELHQAFMHLACAFICQRFLRAL